MVLLSAVAPTSTGVPLGGGGLRTRQPSRLDTLALSLGARCSVSVLLLAAVLVVVLGAASMQTSLRHMRDDLVRMSGDLRTAGKGVDTLNASMSTLPKVQASMGRLVADVDATRDDVGRSATSLHRLRTTTTSMQQLVVDIDASTKRKVRDLRTAQAATNRLDGSVAALATTLGPMSRTQTQLLGGATKLGTGTEEVGDRIGWVVRVLDYMTAPPTTTGFAIRSQLPPSMLPPLPGLHATVDPVAVLPRGAWPVYAGG